MSGLFSNVLGTWYGNIPMAEYSGNACLTAQSLAHHVKMAAMHQPGCATYHKSLLSQNAKRKITKERFSNVCKKKSQHTLYTQPSKQPMVSNELVICKLCKSVHVIVLTCSKWMTFESIIQGDGVVTKRPCTYAETFKKHQN